MQTVRFLRSCAEMKVSLRALAAFSIAAYILTAQPAYTIDSWNVGDVIVGVGDPWKMPIGSKTPTTGLMLRYSSAGSAVQQLNEPANWFTTGCGFYPTASGGELWTTSFTSKVHLFDVGASKWWPTTQKRARPWIDLLNQSNGYAESVAFAPDGSVFVATPYATGAQLLHYTHGGVASNTPPSFIKSYGPLPGGGADWIDVADEDGDVVVYYTAEAADQGASVYRVNITKTDSSGRVQAERVGQPLPGESRLFAIRVLPNRQGVLVASPTQIYWMSLLEGVGVLKSYDLGSVGLFALNISPDGQYFWTATTPPNIDNEGHTASNGLVYKVHIESGQVARVIDTGRASVNGLCVVREYTAAFPTMCTSDAGESFTCRKLEICSASSPGDDDGDQIPDAWDSDCLPPGTPEVCGDAVDNDRNGLADEGCTFQLTVGSWAGGPTFGGMPKGWGDTYLPISYQGRVPSFLDVDHSAINQPDTKYAQLLGVPSHDFAQRDPYLADITVTRANGTTFTGRYYLRVSDPNNHPPELTGRTFDIFEGSLLTFTVQADDRDPGDDATLTYAVTGLPPGAAFDSETNVVSWRPGYDQASANPYAVTVKVSDRLVDTVATFNIRVANTNRAPTLTLSPNLTAVPVDEGSALNMMAIGSDPDPDALTYSFVSASTQAATGASINPVTGAFKWTPTFDQAGEYVVKFVVNDGVGGTAERELTITVNGVTNRPPSCAAATPSVARLWPPNHELVPIQVQGVTDPEGSSVMIRIDGIWQDEPTDTKGDGDTWPDGRIDGSTAWVRAERIGDKKTPGDGRVYYIGFTATDVLEATCNGEVKVGVPHDRGGLATALDSGRLFDSLLRSSGGGH